MEARQVSERHTQAARPQDTTTSPAVRSISSNRLWSSLNVVRITISDQK